MRLRLRHVVGGQVPVYGGYLLVSFLSKWAGPLWGMFFGGSSKHDAALAEEAEQAAQAARKGKRKVKASNNKTR